MLLCYRHELEATGAKGVVINDVSYLVTKQGNHVFAYINRCPHLDIELNWAPNRFMSIDRTMIQCSTHGALFVIDSGECVAGPCLGKSLQAVDISVDDAGGIFLAQPQQ